MKSTVYNDTGANVGEMELSAKLFGKAKVNPAVLQLVVTAMLANLRQPISSTKTRGNVRGGGKKPWKQKGTGRARVGSIRSPLWRGGGIIFGPSPARNYHKKVNRKTKRALLLSVLSDRAQDGRIVVLEDLVTAQSKTRELQSKLKGLEKLLKGRKVLILTADKQENLIRSSRNLANVKIAQANNLNLLDLLWSDNILILKNALPVMEKTYLADATSDVVEVGSIKQVK
jgi:large subunit ribosomal protein L4